MFCIFYGFSDKRENAKNKTTKNRKTKQEIKERVRGTYLSATSGGRCWVRFYAVGAVGGVCVGSAGSTGATRATEGSAGSTGATNGSAGSTRATEVERDTDLESCAISFVVDSAVVPSSVPQANWERLGEEIVLRASKGSTGAELNSEKTRVEL